MAAAPITLNYWNGRGLMEIPRMMLAYAGKFASKGDFKDNRLSVPPENLEANLGRMPTLDVGDAHIGQSNAINYYVAAEHGLLGSSHVDAARILSIQEHAKEMNAEFRKIVPWGTEPTAEQLDSWFDGGATDATGIADRSGQGKRFLSWWLARIENALDSNGFAVGNAISLADFVIYSAFAEHLTAGEYAEGTPAWKIHGFGGGVERAFAKIAQFPKIQASVNAIANNDNIKAYLAARGIQGF